jgi:hypothetical protein
VLVGRERRDLLDRCFGALSVSITHDDARRPRTIRTGAAVTGVAPTGSTDRSTSALMRDDLPALIRPKTPTIQVSGDRSLGPRRSGGDAPRPERASW